MLGGLVTLGSAIISGISGYFKDKNEIKKVQVEADKLLIMAKAEAEANKMRRESEQDYDLDKIAMIAMDKSWKDEFLLILFSIPIAMCFFPEYRQYVEDGFKTLNIIPEWFMYIYVAMIVVIYGLRGLLRMFLQLMIDKIGFKKWIDSWIIYI